MRQSIAAWARARMRLLTALILLAGIAAILYVRGPITPPRHEAGLARLPVLNATLKATSLSGLSSGAYMAGQFQLVHSDIVVGAAIIAGGPWGCAESLFADVIPGPGGAFLNLSKAVNGCMRNALKLLGEPNIDRLVARARKLSETGDIGPLGALQRHRLYLFSGVKDRTVVPEIVNAARIFYERIGLPSAKIQFVASVPAGHAFITQDKGLECGRSGKPYVSDCDYDQAGSLLKHIYGTLAPPATTPAGRLIEFDQREFVRGLSDAGLADRGFAYVPAACRTNTGCRIHVAFHGCGQSREDVGDTFAKSTGFSRWADTNRLIVVFPQASASTVNPQACWDWWGYTGRGYLKKSAPQIVAVRRMLDRLAGLEPTG